MHEMVVILRRELKSYFLSPIAYVFGGLFLAAMMYFGTERLFTPRGPARLDSFFGNFPFLFLLFLPALTMRLWAEERKQGTLELLMTFPVTVAQLIAGKFVAALSFLAVLLLLTFGLPVTIGMFGELDWGPVLCAYLAALLMSGAYIAVGMFCSSLSRDQIIALLVALIVLLALYLLGSPMVLVNLGGYLPEWMAAILGGLSPYAYFSSIARGVFDTRDFIYYLCFCGFFLYANALVLNGRRVRG